MRSAAESAEYCRMLVALMRETLSETQPVRIPTGEIVAYPPVSSDEERAAGRGHSI